jgi:hypothetical protein
MVEAHGLVKRYSWRNPVTDFRPSQAGAQLTSVYHSAHTLQPWPSRQRIGDMPDRILTSHAGSLPRPEDPIALNEQRAEGEFTAADEAEYLSRLRSAVADVVTRQRETGIDLINDGEYGHSMGMKV